ncbi:MAG: flagellar basal-body rod protein FlgG [Deltaproteobacteria bacterium]|nr:flagellar basal-body rod protein FlgG [Deltaproteobacteria bacterium]
MIRALFTAATGMEAQQLNIDVIANNLANVSTTGFKRSRADFQDLLYNTLREPGSAATGTTQFSTGIQVGLGAKPAAIQRVYLQGDFTQTANPLDVAVRGDGLFQITLPDGSLAYTRSGAFKLDSTGSFVTSDGDPITPAITIPAESEAISIGTDGTVTVQIPGQTTPTQIGQIQTVRFANPAGLRAEGRNLFTETETSGTPQLGTPGQEGFGELTQGFLESSNVSVVEELVAMITGQRAYEINSRAVSAADEMLRTSAAIVR